MLAIHDQFTPRLRNRLKTTGIGLGLVRLLQNARRFEDARTVLSTLENGSQGHPDESDKARPKRLKAAARRIPSIATSPRLELAQLCS
jgi:hypothetical protein